MVMGVFAVSPEWQTWRPVRRRKIGFNTGGTTVTRYFLKSAGVLLAAGTLAFPALWMSLLAAPVPAYPNAQQSAPDNTRANKNQTPPTADQQSQDPSDLAITRRIREAIHDDKDLSTYASNIKIITEDGKVTLRGAVRSKEEKSDIEAKAASVDGRENVTNELKVAPSK
jgi:hyperosmotically inducible periplasmic protein